MLKVVWIYRSKLQTKSEVVWVLTGKIIIVVVHVTLRIAHPSWNVWVYRRWDTPKSRLFDQPAYTPITGKCYSYSNGMIQILKYFPILLCSATWLFTYVCFFPCISVASSFHSSILVIHQGSYVNLLDCLPSSLSIMIWNC